MLVVFGCATYWFAQKSNYSVPADLNPAETAQSLRPAIEIQAKETNREPRGRAVYAYSIIPGGVQSVAELKTAIENDPVVSAHYSRFHLEQARIIRLDRDRAVHVSYRLGSEVFWTTRELKLAKGETLITDGVETARTRCGNMISESFVGPFSPSEPTESEFNRPMDATYYPGEPVTDNRFPDIEPPTASFPAPSYEQPVSQPVEPFAPIPWPGSGPTPALPPHFENPQPVPHPSVPANPPVPPGPPVINAPEPGTEIQFLLALAVIAVARRRKSERRA
jgi:hypothetical protein